MTPGYELWETQSGNLMASYEREDEALRAVTDRARRHGSASVYSIALVRIDEGDEDDEMVTLASGTDLLARASNPDSAAQNGHSPGHPQRPADQATPTRTVRGT
jgi:hypothetical protein